MTSGWLRRVAYLGADESFESRRVKAVLIRSELAQMKSEVTVRHAWVLHESASRLSRTSSPDESAIAKRDAEFVRRSLAGSL